MLDPNTGALIPHRKMSTGSSASHQLAQPPSEEFQVLSTADIKNFVDRCGAEVSARWSQMESQMESEISLNQRQTDFMRQEHQADNWRIINQCRNYCENILSEAQQHGRHCMQEVNEHKQMAMDVQRGLLEECGNKQAIISQNAIQLSSEVCILVSCAVLLSPPPTAMCLSS